MGKIVVAGSGKVSVKPNVAVVTFQVLTQGARTSEAIASNNEKMNQLLLVVSEYVDDKDRKTSGFGIHPQYTHVTPRKGQKQKPPTLSGYSCQNGMTLKLRNLDTLSDALGALTDAGADQLSFNFGVDNVQQHEDEARKLAFDDAKRKAVLYCERAGIKLGAVEELNEHVARNIGRAAMGGVATMSAAFESVPVAAGEEDIIANINVTFSSTACAKAACKADVLGGCKAGRFERCKAVKTKKKKKIK